VKVINIKTWRLEDADEAPQISRLIRVTDLAGLQEGDCRITDDPASTTGFGFATRINGEIKFYLLRLYQIPPNFMPSKRGNFIQ